MSGGYFFGLIGLSMAWLLSILLLGANFMAWRAAARARPGERTPSGIPLLPGIVASVTVFFTLPLLKTHADLEVPWPFLWILLPLALDPLGPVAFLFGWLGARRRDPGE
ncbi:MAG TPA: hypothetical protein VIS77_13585 [Burkholderiales bacterium]